MALFSNMMFMKLEKLFLVADMIVTCISERAGREGCSVSSWWKAQSHEPLLTQKPQQLHLETRVTNRIKGSYTIRLVSKIGFSEKL